MNGVGALRHECGTEVDASAPGMLRVLVLCYEYPPAGGGGGRVAAAVAGGLARRGHSVRILTSHVRGLAQEERHDRVTVRRAFAGRRRMDRCSVPEMVAYAVAHAVPALAELRRFRPHVVHAHFAVPTGLVAWFATRLHPVPYVLTAHLGDVPGGVPEQTDRLFRLIGPATRPIWRRAAAVTAVAPHVARLAEAAYGCCPEVIRNGIDMRRGTPLAAPCAGGPLRAIWCGRIQAQKNLAAGIAALAPLAGRAWTLDIVGDGPGRREAEAATRSRGLEGHVRFHGWLPSVAAETLLGAADVLFLPSLSEGLSLTTIEAVRAGLAFVASRIPGVADIVTDGENGILCDPRRPQEFAQAVAALIADRDRLEAMRRASFGRRALFDEERMVAAYEEVLNRASRARRGWAGQSLA